MDQKAVEVPPLLDIRLPRQAEKGDRKVNVDLPKFPGFDGLKGHDDPLDVLRVQMKLHVFELHGFGEVGRRRRSECVWVCGQR